MEVDIKEVSPSDFEVRNLFKLLDEHNMSHCPPEICHLTQPDELQSINSVLLGVYSGGTLAGMGGLKLYSEYAEVTRKLRGCLLCPNSGQTDWQFSFYLS